jgi:hypothetical protein
MARMTAHSRHRVHAGHAVHLHLRQRARTRQSRCQASHQKAASVHFRLLDRVWEGRRLDDPPTRYGFQQLEGQAKIEQAGTPRSVSGFAQKKMPGQPRHMLTPPFFNPNRPLAG